MSTPHMTNLREHLLQTLTSLRDRDTPMEPDRARAIATVASVLVDTARVEVDYIKATGNQQSTFLETRPDDYLPLSDGPTAHNPFPTVRHRLEG